MSATIAYTLVANRSEQRLSCMDSANGDIFTNIRLCTEREREREREREDS